MASLVYGSAGAPSDGASSSGATVLRRHGRRGDAIDQPADRRADRADDACRARRSRSSAPLRREGPRRPPGAAGRSAAAPAAPASGASLGRVRAPSAAVAVARARDGRRTGDGDGPARGGRVAASTSVRLSHGRPAMGVDGGCGVVPGGALPSLAVRSTLAPSSAPTVSRAPSRGIGAGSRSETDALLGSTRSSTDVPPERSGPSDVRPWADRARDGDPVGHGAHGDPTQRRPGPRPGRVRPAEPAAQRLPALLHDRHAAARSRSRRRTCSRRSSARTRTSPAASSAAASTSSRATSTTSASRRASTSASSTRTT